MSLYGAVIKKCVQQTKMNLDWYRGIKPLLSIDKRFDMDHVTAFNHRKIKSKTTGTDHLPHEREKPQSILHKGHETPIPPHLTITPNHCGHFTPFVVLKQLKQNFKTSWHACLNSSSKLDTYCLIKDKFAKEAYLDIVKAYKDRVSLTRLRISAHNLEIEIGRRKSIPRDGRICKWCNISLGADIIENEFHFLDECDLYAKLRRSLYKKTSKLSYRTSISTSKYHPKHPCTHFPESRNHQPSEISKSVSPIATYCEICQSLF